MVCTYTDKSSVRRPLLRLNDEGNDSVCTGTDASGAESCDTPPDDEGCRVLGDTADQTADLEHKDRSEKSRLEVEVAIGLAPRALKGSIDHEEGGAVPADFVESTKLVCDLGDGGRDDGLRRKGAMRVRQGRIGIYLTMSSDARKMAKMIAITIAARRQP